MEQNLQRLENLIKVSIGHDAISGLRAKMITDLKPALMAVIKGECTEKNVEIPFFGDKARKQAMIQFIGQFSVNLKLSMIPIEISASAVSTTRLMIRIKQK